MRLNSCQLRDPGKQVSQRVRLPPAKMTGHLFFCRAQTWNLSGKGVVILRQCVPEYDS